MTVRKTTNYAMPAAQQDRVSFPILTCALVCSVALATVLAVWPKQGQAVGVMFPPNMPLAEMIDRVVRADGGVIDIGAWNMVIAMGTGPNFHRNLRAQGALWVLDGRLSSALCLPRVSTN